MQCASRAGRGAAHRHEGGGVDTKSLSLQRRRNKEVPTAVPPRGVEPRTLPTNRTTGRPGQRVKSRRNLEKGPPGQPTQAVRMVQGEGLRGLRAKVRGEGGCDRWGHALTRAHARSCLADPRTDSTCSLSPAKGRAAGSLTNPQSAGQERKCSWLGPSMLWTRACSKRYAQWARPTRSASIGHNLLVSARTADRADGVGICPAEDEAECPGAGHGCERIAPASDSSEESGSRPPGPEGTVCGG